MGIITPEPENPLSVAGHVVTRVFCNDEGLVCYERDGLPPQRLNEVSPARSRKAALERCKALLDMIPEGDVTRLLPISATGTGLTYDQLKEQTYYACKKSREVEAQREDMMAARMKKYKVDR